MKATLTVKMDNAAFSPEAGTELARILRDLADKVELNGCFGPDVFKVRDFNGNYVGDLKVMGKPNRD